MTRTITMKNDLKEVPVGIVETISISGSSPLAGARILHVQMQRMVQRYAYQGFQPRRFGGRLPALASKAAKSAIGAGLLYVPPDMIEGFGQLGAGVLFDTKEGQFLRVRDGESVYIEYAETPDQKHARFADDCGTIRWAVTLKLENGVLTTVKQPAQIMQSRLLGSPDWVSAAKSRSRGQAQMAGAV